MTESIHGWEKKRGSDFFTPRLRAELRDSDLCSTASGLSSAQLGTTQSCKIFRNWSLSRLWKLHCTSLFAFYLISAPSSELEHALFKTAIIITNSEADDSGNLGLQSQTSRRKKMKISIIWMSGMMCTRLHLKEWVDNDGIPALGVKQGEEMFKKIDMKGSRRVMPHSGFDFSTHTES